MENIEKFIANDKLINSILTILIGVGIYLIIEIIVNKLVEKIKKKNKSNKTKKALTYAKLFKSISKYLILIFCVIVILDINGFNVSSLLAGLGIASVVVGLAIQDALKDIIMGFNILVDHYYEVGDIVKIDSVEGKVIELGLKTTKLKDINTQEIYVVANRNISKALIDSKQFDLDIPCPYDKKINEIEDILNLIIEKVKKIKGIESVEYKGIQEFADSSIKYKLRMHANPEVIPQLKRDIRVIIKKEFDKHNIEIPFMQVDVHSK